VDLPYKYVLVFVCFAVIAVSVYNLFVFLRLRGELRDLKTKWAPLAQGSMQADMLERELNVAMAAEFDFYKTHVEPSFETAEVMNLVSDLLPEGLWLAQFQFVRNHKEIQLILNGLSESKGKDSKLVEIQNFANALKDRLEKILFPETDAEVTKPFVESKLNLPLGMPIPVLYAQKSMKIDATVTTSSEKSAAPGQEPLIQFVATFKTEGFGVQKGP
jgi:hypothetical protein